MKKVNKPVPTGEYAVGTFTYTVKDVREEVMKPGTKRSVGARVYYPVNKSDVEGLSKTEYMSENMTKGMKMVYKVPMNYKKMTESGDNISECYTDAPRIQGEKFPLIVFSPGYGSYREGNSFLCIELASHGYVVIVVDHTMEMICSEFDDGSFVFYNKKIKSMEPYLGGLIASLKLMKLKGTDEELWEALDEYQRKYRTFIMSRRDEWVKDTDAAVEYAREHLSDLIDFQKGIGATGHSAGGNTAYELCATNPDYACGVNMDGGSFGNYKDEVLNVPFLQISCKDNENVVNRFYLRHTKPVYKALFKDMKHMGFSDMKYNIPMASIAGKLDPDILHKNLCRCHLEFFDTYLKGKKSEPDFKDNEAVTFTTYSPDM